MSLPSAGSRKAAPIAAISVAAVCVVAASAAAAKFSAEEGRIGFVSTDLHWSVYQSADGKAECPNGFNEYGPREAFAKLFPTGGTEAQTHLVRESLKFFPTDTKDAFPIPQAVGPIAIGLNLDGKVGPRDFTDPSGRKGIDNELYRLIGCSRQYRGPEGQLQLFANRNIRAHIYNRSMIELTGVSSLENDDDVQVTLYRGLDRLLTDASGDNILPGGTQRVDNRFGKRFTHKLQGKITNGVLTTEPQDVIIPWTIFSGTPGEYRIRGMRLELNLTDRKAQGLMAGYADIDTFYRTLMHWSTHHLAYGQLDPSGFHRMMNRLADGYPDENGKMTAISASINIKMVQVFIEHGAPDMTTVNAPEPTRKGALAGILGTLRELTR